MDLLHVHVSHDDQTTPTIPTAGLQLKNVCTVIFQDYSTDWSEPNEISSTRWYLYNDKIIQMTNIKW